MGVWGAFSTPEQNGDDFSRSRKNQKIRKPITEQALSKWKLYIYLQYHQRGKESASKMEAVLGQKTCPALPDKKECGHPERSAALASPGPWGFRTEETGQRPWVVRMHVRNSFVAQWVKDAVLSLQRCRCTPRPGKFHLLCVQPKTKEERGGQERGKTHTH